MSDRDGVGGFGGGWGGLGEMDPDAKALLAKYATRFSEESEGFDLLRAELLKRWDKGVPVSMMGNKRMMGYMAGEVVTSLEKTQEGAGLESLTIGSALERKATVRMDSKPMPLEGFLKFMCKCAFQELAMTGRMLGDDWHKWVPVFDRWMRDERMSDEVETALAKSLLKHGRSQRILDLVQTKRMKTGFHGNLDFPITPPTTYEMSAVQKVDKAMCAGRTLHFQWARNTPSDSVDLQVCDWNAKLKDDQTNKVLAYAGGTAYFTKKRTGRITPGAMGVAADEITGTYEDAIHQFGLRMPVGSEGPVFLVHLWERHPDAPGGSGEECLRGALRMCAERALTSSSTCFIDTRPIGWRAALSSIMECEALYKRAGTDASMVKAVVEKMWQQAGGSIGGMRVCWLGQARG